MTPLLLVQSTPPVTSLPSWLDFLGTMKGPDFLVLYAVWFFAIFACVLILRKTGYDMWATTFAALLVFEVLGFLRIEVGSQHGMHNFGYLGIMMFVGFIALIARADHFDGNGNGSSGCGGGSSCGGGGGGCGGGCGGCGGG